MNKIGRNDPCPCGSGNKYKKCCLAKDNLNASRRREEQQAIHVALSWLEEQYDDETMEAIHYGFMGEPDEETLDAIENVPAALDNLIGTNIGEWLLADAKLHVDGKDVYAHELVLGAGGPALSSRGREWIQELVKRPLSLYEVKEVLEDEGLVLDDLLNLDQPPVRIREKLATEFLVPLDIFGTRLVWQDDSFVMSGAVYPMERERALGCLSEIMIELEHVQDDPDLKRETIVAIIIEYWFDSILTTAHIPELVDLATVDKLLLTTDHYRVSDWQEFERILAEQDDVDGDQKEGWVRLVELDDGRCRSLASMGRKKADALEVCCRTTQLADEAKEWLENIAGSVIKYKIREIVDPRSEKVLETAKPLQKSDIPLDVQRQIIHQFLSSHYEGWVDTPLPALNGKTPLEAAKDKNLQTKVVELLEGIDQLEARRVKETGGEPFDASFLWERLGLQR